MWHQIQKKEQAYRVAMTTRPFDPVLNEPGPVIYDPPHTIQLEILDPR